ncbi:ABC transporter permease [Rhodococcus sp. ARC_M6]|uniref:ABC transporter permease n=1 Tax=Rhodococcus sp. ARC_M6 TaxID=2928852 RepID=UPI001FB36E03|nr:ABC transporter permease [Rhodococcus sp. ARC_M6]MCJ0906400.1 ABC transporter permease [Rhodococcus sp. ARC_M6]
MIWVTWRHHRTSLTISLGIIAALAVTALIGGVVSEIMTTVIATLLPVLLGALVGVTVFSRDIEQGTHVLGLTQSVSRARWFWMRVLVVFVPLSVAAALLGFVLEWTRAADGGGSYVFVSGSGQLPDISNLTYPFFQSSGLALGAYTFMALVLGAALALMVRSSIGAMALTMVGVVVVLAVFQFVARPHYAPLSIEASPLDRSSSYALYTSDDVVPGIDWEIESGNADIRGNFVDVRYDECSWTNLGSDAYEWKPDETDAQYDERIEVLQEQEGRDMEVCLREQGVDHFETRYHSADQFHRFQLMEAALVLVLSGLILLRALSALRRVKP